MLETTIEAGMYLAGRPLREAKLPPDTLVVSIRREGDLLFPRGRTIILPGDVVTFLTSPRGEEYLQHYLAGQRQEADSLEGSVMSYKK
jgi:Trk K+ transport system NAD-binding subunit